MDFEFEIVGWDIGIEGCGAGDILKHNDAGLDLSGLPKKGFFDLGDIAALVDPDLARWEVTDCPEVGWDLAYRFTGKTGTILRVYDIDRSGAFALLYDRLRAAYR